MPSYPLTHLKQVAAGRRTNGDHYEVGHFTEELFCRFNFTEGKFFLKISEFLEYSKVVFPPEDPEIAKKQRGYLHSTPYGIKVTKLFVLLFLMAIFYFIKYEQKWALGVNPHPYCLKDHALGVFDMANDGIWDNKFLKFGNQILSSAVIDIPLIILGLMW